MTNKIQTSCAIRGCLFFLLALTACQANPPQSDEMPVNERNDQITVIATDTIGETSTPTIEPTQTIPATTEPILQSGQDEARFISESIPDGSYLTPGESFTKTWTLENSGSNTWTTDYQLVVFASPQGDTLGSPTSIAFPEIVQPGDKVEFRIPLVAPQSKGSYAVYWQLQNAQNEPFYVDGGNLWTQIMVAEAGEQVPQSYTQTVTFSQLNGISVELIDIGIGPSESYADFCVYFPAGEEKMVGGSTAISLIYNGRQTVSTAGNTLNTNDPATMGGAHRCYHFVFPVTQVDIPDGTPVSVSISSLRYMDTNAAIIEANCAQASIDLPAQYPGLSFTCLPFSAGAYYSGLQLPASMTEAQANQLILDAIQDAVYGPWVLTAVISQ